MGRPTNMVLPMLISSSKRGLCSLSTGMGRVTSQAIR